MSEYLARNRQTWDRWAEINFESEFYGVAEFRAGHSVRPGLDRLEAELLGDVRGKTLLHLMCHFGLDTLSQARRGATVTGVDFSSRAIEKARTLASDLEIEATFVESDLYDLDAKLAQRFDVVFSSIGVLSWLPDLARWARIIERRLEPGGRFVLIEAHPTALLFDEQAEPDRLVATYPYFESAEPLRLEQTGCYSRPEHADHFLLYEWQHSLSEILTSLLEAGLALQHFSEHDYIAWKLFPWLVEREDRCFELPGNRERLPLMFSLVAHKPETEPRSGASNPPHSETAG